jgi:hypothetical protein
LIEMRPETIMRSDCRGEKRMTSEPNRAMSYRPERVAIISMAQHAVPNGMGHRAFFRAQATTADTVVVNALP